MPLILKILLEIGAVYFSYCTITEEHNSDILDAVCWHTHTTVVINVQKAERKLNNIIYNIIYVFNIIIAIFIMFSELVEYATINRNLILSFPGNYDCLVHLIYSNEV